MSVNISNVFTQQYDSTVKLLLQENGSKLAPYVMSGSHVGKQASPVNQIGSVTMRQVTSRFAPKVRADASYARRWVQPADFTLDQALDSWDVLKTIVDPKGAYAQNAMMAANRQKDLTLITAALGVSVTGEQGGSTESFDTTNYSIAANFGGAPSGLTVVKLIEARQKWRTANVDLEADPMTIVIAPKQEANLLNQVEVVSTDFNDRPVLVDGRVTRFLGFNIVVSNQLTLSSTSRYCIAFVKSGLYLGVWDDVKSDAHQRFDLEGNPWELTTTMSIGATRLEQGRILRVIASEA